MPLTLDALPFDALFNIASWLYIEDFVHLGGVNKQLRSLMREESACRRTVEVSNNSVTWCTSAGYPLQGLFRSHELIQTHISCTKEALIAQKGLTTYYRALQRVHSRKEAFSSLTPFSALVLAYGATFVYKQGVLCYLHDSSIRILHVHHAAKFEQVVDLGALFISAGQGHLRPNHETITLLNYSDNILVVLYEAPDNDESSWLLAFDTKADRPDCERVLVSRPLETSARIFARHNESYLYYGTHSGIGSHGHHEWIITCIPIHGDPALCPETIQLDDLVGSDIGLTVYFEIFDGFFYALSNQTSFEVEEVDWTSYFHCYRFPLDRPKSNFLQHEQIWRRNHVEGPINDSWTDLGLHRDESTGKLMIIEARREWQGGGSSSRRTYYTEPVNFPDEPSTSEGSSLEIVPSSTPNLVAMSEPNFLALLPTDDQLVSTLTEGDKPHYEPPHMRIDRHTHSDDDGLSTAVPSFILAKTKYRNYNPSSSAFLDVVNDPLPPSAATNFRLRQRLRLRVGSRKRAPPAYAEPDYDGHKLLKRPKIDPETDEPVEGSEEAFIDRGVKMWPPDDAPVELYEILNPVDRASGEVTGVADERSLIYMTGSSASPQYRAIVLVNFDPAIRFPGLREMMTMGGPQSAGDPSGRVVGVELDGRRSQDSFKCNGNGKEAEHCANNERTCSSGKDNRWFWVEEAQYLGIGKGASLR